MGGTHCESALYGYFQNNKRHVSFSQLVTMLRLTLMYYTGFISFMENPQNDELMIMVKRANALLKGLDLFD